MSHTLALALPLLVAPPDAEPLSFDVASTELVSDENGVQVIAYGPTGEIVGQIGVWYDGDTTTILADYGDGYAISEVTGDQVTTTATLSPDELSARHAAILLELGAGPQAGWAPCLWSAGATVGACAAARPILCVGGSIVTACNCLPELIREFEDIQCPGW